ncbi:MAG: ATP-binding protein [Gammaproteobacteria bacterium]|nr:ATP-binding protein [Gammaproteobacteria bacterium]
MERTALNVLTNWLTSVGRKPLVIRGARQVGKTWLVRHFAKTVGKTLVELNFEKQPSYASFFSSNDPQQILLNLTAVTNEKISSEHSLLFLDEIQAVPQLLSKLRWFSEDLPQLPVIVAGSLLEFVLAEHSFSMPVGRISYMHLEPLSFEEFLLANDKKSLFDYLKAYDLTLKIPLAIHEQLIMLFKAYLLVGGLPSAVANWIFNHSPDRVSQVQYDLLATYRDDFAKYKARMAGERLEEVMIATPKMLGQKFVFSRVNASHPSITMKQVLTFLEKARICYRVQGCAANGVPLAAEIKEKYFKEIFLDTGLCCAMLGLNLSQINAATEITLINQGGIAEQVVGQLFRTVEPSYIEPTLYCWHREEQGASAEIDYIVSHGSQVIPVEVKAGSTGSLKSLHLFMGLKKFNIAIRINSDFPSKMAIKTKDNLGNCVEYTLVSLPFYLVGEIHRLLG